MLPSVSMIHLLILAVHLLATITKLVHGEFVIALRLAFSWSATNERLVNAIPIVINSAFFQLSRAQHLFRRRHRVLNSFFGHQGPAGLSDIAVLALGPTDRFGRIHMERFHKPAQQETDK